jgi:hypothetical protein
MADRSRRILPPLQEVIFYANHPRTHFCTKLAPIQNKLSVSIAKTGEVTATKKSKKNPNACKKL